jgi:hypothetical protein
MGNPGNACSESKLGLQLEARGGSNGELDSSSSQLPSLMSPSLGPNNETNLRGTYNYEIMKRASVKHPEETLYESMVSTPTTIFPFFSRLTTMQQQHVGWVVQPSHHLPHPPRCQSCLVKVRTRRGNIKYKSTNRNKEKNEKQHHKTWKQSNY